MLKNLSRALNYRFNISNRKLCLSIPRFTDNEEKDHPAIRDDIVASNKASNFTSSKNKIDLEQALSGNPMSLANLAGKKRVVFKKTGGKTGLDIRNLLRKKPGEFKSGIRDDVFFDEREVNLDDGYNQEQNLFPDETTNEKLFNGIKFKDIPIIFIRCSKNNTIMNFYSVSGKQKNVIVSCGSEGFKNCKKGTNVAAQVTGLSLAQKLRKNNNMTVRLKVKGLGPGRMSSVKGLVMGGVNIVSVTDATPIDWGYSQRPRKERRI